MVTELEKENARLREAHGNAVDKVDMYRDEFLRIKAETDEPLILTLCDRAIADIERNFPLIIQCETYEKNWLKAEQERDELREALEKLVHLHLCEQEGIGIGMPTAEEWIEAVKDAEQALNGKDKEV
jgi:hypothetical protein